MHTCPYLESKALGLLGDLNRSPHSADVAVKGGQDAVTHRGHLVTPMTKQGCSEHGVVVVNQGGPVIRHIYLNVTHSKNVKPSWYGESVGHYENGDTLVIDTVGISTKSFIDNYRTPHTDQLRVVERWKLAADGKTVDISVFVEDPGAFTMPWDAIQRFRQYEAAVRSVLIDRLTQLASAPEGPLKEMRCADNPNSFFPGTLSLPLPQATTPDF